MQEVNQIQYLKYHLGNLKIIKNHIVLHHLPQRSMVMIEDQEIGVFGNLLLCCHMRRYSTVVPNPFSYRNTIETNQISARVGLQLLNIEEERL